MPNANMTVKDALEQLEALGDEKVRAHNTKFGAGTDQFGVKLGDICQRFCTGSSLRWLMQLRKRNGR